MFLFVKGCRVSFGIEQSFLADVGITHRLTRFKVQLLYQEGQCLFKAHQVGFSLVHPPKSMELVPSIEFVGGGSL